tara:strand:- start:235 stop:1056 length:822 start_codon:yes stop_codon:yes gene_type:complete
MSIEFYNKSYYDRVNKIIDSLKLKETPTDNDIIKNRFLYEVIQYENKRDNTKKYYNGLRFVMTIGSILLPAILSIGQMDPAKLPANFDLITYWASWSLSLTITACNGFLQLFSLDKNFIAYSLVTEQLKTEGWQYFQLSGKYTNAENHEQAFKQFCKSIEGIKRKQVEQEYNGKGEDKKNKFDFDKELKKTLPSEHQTDAQKEGGDEETGKQSNPGSNPLEDISTAVSVASGIGDMKEKFKNATSELDESLSVQMDRITSRVTAEEGSPKGSE